MKKILFSVMACLFGMSNAMADELIIKNVELPLGDAEGVEVPVEFKADADGVNVGFTFNLVLPEGVSTIKDEDGVPEFDQNSSTLKKFTVITTENDGFAAIPQTTSATIKGTEGELITFYLKTDKEFEVGTELTATVTKAAFTAKDADGKMSTVSLPDFTFTIKIVEGTGINTVKANDKASTLYTIDGKKVNKKGNLPKGVYVIDGKKVVK